MNTPLPNSPFFSRFSCPAGVRYMLLGTICFSFGILFVKMAGTRIPTMEILFLRAIVGICYCFLLIRRSGAPVLGKRKLLLLLRGSLGFGSFACQFYAFVHLPLADATVLIFLYPVFVALLAVPLLGEKLGRLGIVSIVLSLVGAACVTRPSFLFGTPMPLPPLAVGLALSAALLSGFAIVTVRTLAQTEHPISVIVYPLLIILAVTPVLDGANWVLPDAREWTLLLGMGVLMNLGQHLMTKGYQKEKAAYIASISYLEILFAALFGWIVFDHVPDGMTFLGASLIIAGMIALTRETMTRARPQIPHPTSTRHHWS